MAEQDRTKSATQTDKAPMLQVQNLGKNYAEVQAVRDLNFSIQQGEIVGFLGPNGAGKSTTLRIVTGCLPASQGRSLVLGQDIAEQPIAVKKNIGYLPEVPPLYPDLSVDEQLLFACRLKGIVKAKQKQAIERVVERAQLAEVRRRLVAHLSKGFRQRVGIAQALLGEPPLLILDEPSAGLDPQQIGSVRELIKSLADEHTVLLSTHILSEVTATCQRAIIIANGRCVADASLKNLAAAHGNKSLEEIFLSLTQPGAQSIAKPESSSAASASASTE